MTPITSEIDIGSLSDAEIIAFFLESGDKKALSVLYQRYSNSIYHKCYAMVHNIEVAKDLTHDIFIKAFLKLSTLKSGNSFKGWINTITYNMCINHLNLQQKLKINPLDQNKDPNNSYQEEEKKDKILLEITLEQLEYLLSKMQELDRMILLMRYQDEMSVKEIQNVLNIGASAVKMRLKRAKEKLAKLFQEINR